MLSTGSGISDRQYQRRGTQKVRLVWLLRIVQIAAGCLAADAVGRLSARLVRIQDLTEQRWIPS